jgi:hypothetical protein
LTGSKMSFSMESLGEHAAAAIKNAEIRINFARLLEHGYATLGASATAQSRLGSPTFQT